MTIRTAGHGQAAATAPQTLLLVLSGNMLLDALEVSSIFVALPSITGQFALSPQAAYWLQGGFAIGFGSVALCGGRLGTALGRRRVYLAALGLFALASAAAAAAPTAALVVAARALKGGCVALTAPTGLAIISELFPDGPPRHRALRVYAACGAAGLALGAVLSGALTEVSWRYALAFPVPVALALGWLAARTIPADSPSAGQSLWRSVSSLLVILAGMSFLVAAIGGPGSRRLSVLLGIGLLGLVCCGLERASIGTVARLLSISGYWRSVCGAALLNGSFWGLLLALSMTTQARGHWPPAATAMLVLLAGAVTFVLTLRAPIQQARFGTERLIATGWVLTVIGYATGLLPPA